MLLGLEEDEIVQATISEIYNGLAILYAHTDRLDESIDLAKKVIKIREELVELSPQKYMSDLGYAYQNAASIYEDRKEFENATKKYQKALGVYKHIAEENPVGMKDYILGVHRKSLMFKILLDI